MINFLKRDVFLPETLTEEQQKKQYARIKWYVFLSATIGYGLYYVCRLCINVIKTPLIKEGILTETELGVIGSCLFFSYAFGKFVNGFVADRVNIRKFMSLGLFFSALICFALGFTTSFIGFAILWTFNGWFQSMGSTPSVIALTRWFKPSERGSFYGFWSASHNIGESITFIVIAFIVTAAGWQWGFWGAGLFGVVGAIIIYSFLFDSPESKGLFVLKNQAIVADVEKTSVSKQQLDVLKTPAIWVLAFSSSFMYISRYAVNSWGIFFLENDKGFTVVEASSIVSVSSICGILGTVSSGVVSDKFFKGKRNFPNLIFGVLNALSIGIFLNTPKEQTWLLIVSMVIFGISIGALICLLGGLMAVEIAPKNAVGAAMGVVGVASYIGAGLQDIVSGYLIENAKTVTNGVVVYDFTIPSLFWIGAAVLSFVLATFIWNAKRKE
ncbi:MFS transporter [Pedobacter xixiisoli]|uniref:MFS transporter, OPA family, sugar phosphate sensor protein UhpC n=1 Tax=Pedobacter xixiisoli TaxID=1476464 RepID=A0A286A8T1_9SPHI|nr:MFS transporter [Pedobacter xixiisoli]SOD18314.1 MFS transporter, OPA family, sugar phosphate sensor protein UhpC [Pedobacter xixiisoli]